MGHLLGAINQAKLDEQRGVVQNEKRQGENQPYGRAYELIPDATYPAGHPYSWTVIGSMEDLNAASLDDVKEWFKTYYGPPNAVLVDRGRREARRREGESGEVLRRHPARPPIAKHECGSRSAPEPSARRLQDRVPQARIYKVWNVPEWGAADDDYLDLVDRRAVRPARPRASTSGSSTTSRSPPDVCADVDSAEIAGQFVIAATAKPGGDLAEVEKAIDEELARFLARRARPPRSSSGSRRRPRPGFIRGIERIGGFGGKSDILAQSQVFGGSPTSTRPASSAWRRRPPPRSRRRPGLALGRRLHPRGAAVPRARGGGRAGSTGSPAPSRSLPEADLPAFERATLSNGLKLVVAERHGVPVVNLDLLVDAGYAADQFAGPAPPASP